MYRLEINICILYLTALGRTQPENDNTYVKAADLQMLKKNKK